MKQIDDDDVNLKKLISEKNLLQSVVDKLHTGMYIY
jgi:hypothetical protein